MAIIDKKITIRYKKYLIIFSNPFQTIIVKFNNGIFLSFSLYLNYLRARMSWFLSMSYGAQKTFFERINNEQKNNLFKMKHNYLSGQD
jgi:hypothetical protein